MLKHLRPALAFTVMMTVLTGIVYPLAMTGVSQLLFPEQSAGSLIEKDGKVIGSKLIGQNFRSEKYFHGRPSATSAQDPSDATKTVPAPYNAANSSGSNMGPTNQALIDGVKAVATQLHAKDDRSAIPVDLVTSSGSGLDPHMTPAAAQFQIPRVAKARNLPESEIAALVAKYKESRLFGLIGEKRVNVLMLNVALDALSQGQI